MVEGVDALTMDCLGIENKEKKMVELLKHGSVSEGIQKDQAGMNVVVTESAAEANSNSNSCINKNPSRSDCSLRNKLCEKGSFTSILRMGLAFEEEYNEEKGFPSWNRNVNGGAKKAVAEFTPSLDLSSIGSYTSSINLFPNQSGFGSPVAVNGDFEHRKLSEDDDHDNDDHDSCSGFLTSCSSAASTNKQPCAPLTIFYGGAVKVYDDIPADQAQAIMLIAGSGNYSSYRCTKVQKGSCGSETQLKKSLPFMKLSDRSGIHHQPANCRVQIDLPIGRRHSLQRFLEKRKNRLNANAKSPYTSAKADN